MLWDCFLGHIFTQMPLIRLEYMVGVLSAVRHITRQSSGGVSVHTIVDPVCVVPNTLYFTLKPLQKQPQRWPCLTAWRRGTMWQNLFMGRYVALLPTPSRSAAYVIYVCWFELVRVGKSKHLWMIDLHKQLSILFGTKLTQWILPGEINIDCYCFL